MRFLDPRAEPSTPVEPYSVRPIAADGAATIGLLANGFPDSVAFLDAVEQELVKVAPLSVRVRRYAKPNASAPMTDALAELIVGECDALVTAYGH